MVADAIESWIEAAVSSGRLVPTPRQVDEEYSGRFVLRVTRSLHARLTRIARQEGVSLNAYCASVLAEGAGTADVRRVYAAARYAVMIESDAAVLRRNAEAPGPYVAKWQLATGSVGATGAQTMAQIMRRPPEVTQ
jgi:hypothetical protein